MNCILWLHTKVKNVFMAEAMGVKEKRWRVYLALAMACAALAVGIGRGPEEKPEPLSYSEFWSMARGGRVESVVMGSAEQWSVTLKDGTRAQTPNPRAADGKERLLALDIAVREAGEEAPGMLLGAVALGALLLLARARGRGTEGMQKYAAVYAEASVPDVTFRDVAVPGETLQSMEDLVAFLKEPARFSNCGARAPKGVMLYGPPGTGKTLLARALAGEAKAPFFAMGGADFVQVYVGVGASRVRELFRKARKAGGGVIFIDEIDAIGKKRDSGNDEREQTLNALLTEMSGFSGGDGIIVMAATNRLDTLDPALLREGRFDRRIEVGLPDAEQRLKILRVHARNKPMAPGVSLEKWARQTAMFSGAQLETLLNEAAIRTARRRGESIGEADVEQAFCALVAGEDRPRQLTPREKKITAWHEAGHALITRRMLPDTRVARVTVIPSSRGAAGYSMSIQPDRVLHSRQELMGMICAALGGRAAEEMLLGKENVTTGAADDLKRAREIARAMADDFAMGATGRPEEDERGILQEAMEKTRACLAENRQALERLAGALTEKETLREADVLEIAG